MYEYSLKNDISLVCKVLDISKLELSKRLGISSMSINRWEHDKLNELSDTMVSFYDYVFSENIVINKIKEMFYRDSLKNGERIIFHGSKYGLDGKIDVKKSKNTNDFGTGFYCGDTFDQSAVFVSNFDKSSIYILKLRDNNLKKLTFAVEKDWMLSIAYFRGKLESYKNSKIIKNIIDKINSADLIIAPIADNRMFEIIDDFINGNITDIQCKHCLSATNLGMQYVFKTKRAIKKIEVLERCYICKKEKEYYLKFGIEGLKNSLDKVKFARKTYSNKGRYIDDLL